MSLTRFEFTRRARPILEVGIGSTVLDDGAGLWDVSLWDAPGSTWNGDEPLWRDVACDVIDAHIELGRGRITDAFPVGTAEVTVDNGSGWADPSIDFEVDSVPGYISLPGTAGNYLTMPDAPSLNISGDMCVAVKFIVDEWPPALVTGFIAAKENAWSIVLMGTGQLALYTVAAGILTISVCPEAITPATSWRWYAVALDANNGAGGHQHRWFYGGNGDDPTWVLFDEATDAGVVSIDDSNLPTSIGFSAADGFVGRVGHVDLYTGTGPGVTVGGTKVLEVNSWDFTEADVDATTITPRLGPSDFTVVRTGDPHTEITAAVRPDLANLKLRPGRGIRIGVEHQTLGTKWLYRGFIDSIEPVDDPEDWSTVKLVCIDALGEAGRAKLASDVEVGAGEQSKTRFARILNTIQWPSTKRAISASAIRPLLAAEMDGQVVDLLRQTAESEGGWAFADTDGDVVLQHRDWLYHVVGSAVDGTIGNVGVGTGFSELLLEDGEDLLLEQSDEMLLEVDEEGGDVCPGKWVRAFDRRDITTRAILDRDIPSDYGPAPSPVIANDIAAQILYGIEPFERLDLWTQNTGDLQQIIGRIMATRSAAVSMPRIRGVSLDAAASDSTVDLLSSISIFTPSRYRGRLQKDGRLVFDSKFFAVGVTHDLSAEAWTADVSLDRSFPFEVLDPADYIWDTARWDRSLWN